MHWCSQGCTVHKLTQNSCNHDVSSTRGASRANKHRRTCRPDSAAPEKRWWFTELGCTNAGSTSSRVMKWPLRICKENRYAGRRRAERSLSQSLLHEYYCETYFTLIPSSMPPKTCVQFQKGQLRREGALRSVDTGCIAVVLHLRRGDVGRGTGKGHTQGRRREGTETPQQ